MCHQLDLNKFKSPMNSYSKDNTTLSLVFTRIFQETNSYLSSRWLLPIRNWSIYWHFIFWSWNFCLNLQEMALFKPLISKFPGGACPPDPPSGARLWRTVMSLILTFALQKLASLLQFVHCTVVCMVIRRGKTARRMDRGPSSSTPAGMTADIWWRVCILPWS